MTLTEANDLANTLNAQLKLIGADNTVVYRPFAYWDNRYVKYYNVVYFPKEYDAKFETATDSQKLAFARVSILAQSLRPIDVENFVLNFASETLKDIELNDYLKN